jgi:pyrophosphatase PpaX
MRTHFGEVPPDQVWLETLGTPLRHAFKRFSDSPEGVQELTDTYLEFNLRMHEELIRPFEGIRDILQELLARERRLGIVTSKAAAGTARSLAACGLPEAWFEAIVTADEPVPHKPDPAPVRLALERLGAEPGVAAFIGDSVWDMRAGRGAGVKTIAALWGPFSEDELVSELPDLMIDSPPDLLSEL